MALRAVTLAPRPLVERPFISCYNSRFTRHRGGLPRTRNSSISPPASWPQRLGRNRCSCGTSYGADWPPPLWRWRSSPRPSRRRDPSTAAPARGPGRTSSTSRPRTSRSSPTPGIWKAQPILVSGASAYRDGEFLYQDFLYDDHGAREAARPRRPAHRRRHVLASRTGTYTYPTDAGLRAATPPTSSSCASSRCRRDRVPRHAEHAQGPRR